MKRQRTGRALVLDLWQRLKRPLVFLTIISIFAAIAESFGLVLLVPILSSIGGDAPDWLPALPDLEILFILFVAAMLARAGLFYLRDAQQSQFVHRYMTSLRDGVASSIARLGWSRANLVGQARMQRYLQTDIPRSTQAAAQVQSGIVATVTVAIQAGLALLISPVMTLVAALLLGFVVAFSWRWVRESQVRSAALSLTIDDSTQSGYSLRAGLKAALAEGRSSRFLEHYRGRLEAERDQWVAIDIAQARARLAQQVGGAIALTALLYAGLVLLDLAIPVLILLVILFARLQAPVRAIVDMIQSFWVNAPAFEDIHHLFAMASASPMPATGHGPPLDWQTLELRQLEAGIEDVTIAPPIDLSLERGKVVAVTGPSGSGKSVLLDTIAGLYPPVSGEIHLDGECVDLTQSAGWARQLGYVGQHDLLLGESVGEMLDLDPASNMDDVGEMIAALGLTPLLDRFGSDLDQPLGEHGAALSGGEKQRIAIARVILRAPSLLILDEATAALDLESEKQIFDFLRKTLQNSAILIISHRPESQSVADMKLSLA